jgi:hypothetical protein
MSQNEQTPETEAFIAAEDRPHCYNPEKRVSRYTIGELASLFDGLTFWIKDLDSGNTRGPIYAEVKPIDGLPSGDLDDFTIEGLLKAIERLEWRVADKDKSFHGEFHIMRSIKGAGD